MNGEKNSGNPLLIIVTIFTILNFVAVMFLAIYVMVKISTFEESAQKIARGFGALERFQQRQPPPPPSPPAEPEQTEASIDDDPVKGDVNAEVTIIEFSDFQCPFCARWARDTLPQIHEKYVKTGKVRFIFRDFPLNFHPMAKPAALAAQCAHEQGKFWQMHDKIFENQNSLSNENLLNWAKEIGLNMSRFKDCFEKGKYNDEIDKDVQDGMSYGVRGTPSFIIGKTVRGSKTIKGEFVRGAQPYPAFEQVIEKYLK